MDGDAPDPGLRPQVVHPRPLHATTTTGPDRRVELPVLPPEIRVPARGREREAPGHTASREVDIDSRITT
ncbi:hypothetical protein GCM10010433_07960 [Streptomyces pulveraceus]